jgi:type II secretory pathway component PulC
MPAGLVALIALVALGCGGPMAPTTPRMVDHDLDVRATPAPAETTEPRAEPRAEPHAEPRAVAPPGKGLRTGTIARARLVAVLDAGPGTFLRQLEVAPRLVGDRFVGWQLVQLIDRRGPLHDVDLLPGDVLLAVNGKPLARPDELQAVWDSLRMANDVTVQLSRGAEKLELHFTIEPPLDRN